MQIGSRRMSQIRNEELGRQLRRPPGYRDVQVLQLTHCWQLIIQQDRTGPCTWTERHWRKAEMTDLSQIGPDSPKSRRLYSYVLWWESSLCKTPHFQWIYGKLNQIYEKLKNDQMDQKSTLGGPTLISRTVGSLLKNWSYTSNQCIYFSILLDWRSHLAKTLLILHKYIKCALL